MKVCESGTVKCTQMGYLSCQNDKQKRKALDPRPPRIEHSSVTLSPRSSAVLQSSSLSSTLFNQCIAELRHTRFSRHLKTCKEFQT